MANAVSLNKGAESLKMSFISSEASTKLKSLNQENSTGKKNMNAVDYMAHSIAERRILDLEGLNIRKEQEISYSQKVVLQGQQIKKQLTKITKLGQQLEGKTEAERDAINRQMEAIQQEIEKLAKEEIDGKVSEYLGCHDRADINQTTNNRTSTEPKKTQDKYDNESKDLEKVTEALKKATETVKKNLKGAPKKEKQYWEDTAKKLTYVDIALENVKNTHNGATNTFNTAHTVHNNASLKDSEAIMQEIDNIISSHKTKIDIASASIEQNEQNISLEKEKTDRGNTDMQDNASDIMSATLKLQNAASAAFRALLSTANQVQKLIASMEKAV